MIGQNLVPELKAPLSQLEIFEDAEDRGGLGGSAFDRPVLLGDEGF